MSCQCTFVAPEIANNIENVLTLKLNYSFSELLVIQPVILALLLAGNNKNNNLDIPHQKQMRQIWHSMKVEMILEEIYPRPTKPLIGVVASTEKEYHTVVTWEQLEFKLNIIFSKVNSISEWFFFSFRGTFLTMNMTYMHIGTAMISQLLNYLSVNVFSHFSIKNIHCLRFLKCNNLPLFLSLLVTILFKG